MSLSRRALLLAASAAPFAANAAEPAGIVCPLVAEPAGLIPGVFKSLQARLLGSKIYSGLCRIGPDGAVQPDLAEGWELSSDQLTYIFHLRPGLTWHDSGGVDSDDVAFSLDRFHRALQPQLDLSRVVSVRATDPHTVVITLSMPHEPFLRQLDALCAPIVPRHIHDRPGFGVNPRDVTPVGSGPFRMAEWLRLVRFDWFAGPKPAVAEITYPSLPDPAARMELASRPGVLMVGNAVDPAAIPRLRQIAGLAVGGEPGTATVGLRLNHAAKPLDDKRVRLGLACAIDRDALLRDVWFGLGRAASGPLVAGNPQSKLPPYDPRAGAAHLTEAGLKPDDSGIRLRLTQLVPPGRPWQQLAQLVRLFLQQIGVDLVLEPVPEADIARRVAAGDYQLTSFTAEQTGNPAADLAAYAADLPGLLPLLTKTGSALAEAQTMLVTDCTQLWLVEPAIPVVADRHLVLPGGPFSNFATARFV